eukprot:474648-Rhodomonas_salina.1
MLLASSTGPCEFELLRQPQWSTRGQSEKLSSPKTPASAAMSQDVHTETWYAPQTGSCRKQRRLPPGAPTCPPA